MATNSNGTGEPPHAVDGTQVDRIFISVWEAAARFNPMLLSKLPPSYPLERLRKMIADCLTRGISEAKTHYHALTQFLRSAETNRLPPDNCDDLAAPKREGEVTS
jgi:hypothetical protein